jgi:type VI secretion system protein ImpL
MKKFFKFLLIVLIWILVLGIIVATSILFEQTIEFALTIFAIVFGTWYGIKLIVFLFKRWQAKRRVEKLINVESNSETQKKLSFMQFLAPKDIDKHIQRVIKRTEAHGLNAPGSQSEVPWVMHVKFNQGHGDWVEQNSANRPKMKDPIFQEFTHLNWRPFNQFLMLDIDPYLVESHNPSAKNEWLQLLNALSYSKKRIALDQLLVSVHINDIKDEQSQNKLADRIRALYEEVKEYCGVAVPINIVLVGMEELSGIKAWLQNLEKDSKQQSLGYINENNTGASEIVGYCFEELKSIFRQGSIEHLVSFGFNAEAAQLPHKAAHLQMGISHCLQRIFDANRFQQAPILAGVFIAMKQEQEYAFCSELLESSALCWQKSTLTEQATVSDKLKQKKLITYLAASAIFSSLLYTIYDYNQGDIVTAFDNYTKNIAQSDEQSDFVSNLHHKYRLIQQLSDIHLAHWWPTSSDPFELAKMRNQLMKEIDDQLIKPIDSNFVTKLDSSEDSDLDAKIDYLNILVRRINVINAALDGASLQDLALMPQPYDESYINGIPSELLADINDIYLKRFVIGRQSDLVFYTQAWQKEIETSKSLIGGIVLSNDSRMSWLLDWVNANQGIKDVSLNDYWNGTLQVDNLPKVQRVYTLAGKKMIDDFVEQIKLALGQEAHIVTQTLPDFLEMYQKNYLANWGAFLKQFNEGRKTLRNRQEWLSTINNLPTGRNLFFKLLNDVDYQLEPFKDSEPKQDWFEFVLYYQDMLALGGDKLQNNSKKNKVFTKLALKLVGKAGPVGKALAGAGKSSLKTKKKLDKASGDGPGPSEREINLQAAAAELDNYKKLIADMVFTIEQSGQSLANIQGLYANADNPSAAGTPLAMIQDSIKKLQSLIGKAGISTQAFWNVYEGPIALMQSFMLDESACQIDQNWQDKYLFELEGVPSYKIDEVAYGEGGVLWSYVDQQLVPFLKPKRSGGYSFKRIAGQTLPLDSDLLNYLARARDASQQQKFESLNFSVTAQPTSLNKSALLYVSKTELNLQCVAGAQSLVNNNFRISKNFIWDPSCGPVSLSFTIGNKVVVKEYPGMDGLTRFLTDFIDGEQTFELESFPQHFYVLNQYQIRHIKVALDIEGGRKLLNALSQKPPQPPSHIAQCWK